VKSGRARRLPKARLARYRMQTSDLEALLTSQDGRCAICRKAFDGPRSFQIDHCHVSGKVRGALCPSCNNGLGAFGDSAQRLEAAITYLADRT